jgi:hypothetical protein
VLKWYEVKESEVENSWDEENYEEDEGSTFVEEIGEIKHFILEEVSSSF